MHKLLLVICLFGCIARVESIKKDLVDKSEPGLLYVQCNVSFKTQKERDETTLVEVQLTVDWASSERVLWNTFEWMVLEKMSKGAANGCPDEVICVQLKRSVHSNTTFLINCAFDKDVYQVEKRDFVIGSSAGAQRVLTTDAPCCECTPFWGYN